MLGHDGVSMRAPKPTWLSGATLAVLLAACDPEPVVQLSVSVPVRDAGMSRPGAAGASAIPEWEKYECEVGLGVSSAKCLLS